MHRMSIIVLAFASAAAAGSERPIEKPRIIRIESAFLRLIDQVDVPAQAAGVLAKIAVREGLLVKEDELLAQMDDVDAALALEKAQLDLDIARRLAANQAKVEQAQAVLSEAESAKEKARLELEIARHKAESDVALRYAKKAAVLAENELQRAIAARKEFRDSVSQNEFEHLQLTFDKAKLDVEQADQDVHVAGLNRLVKQAEAGGLDFTVRRRQIELKQAGEDLLIAAITQRVKEHDLAVAQRELDRRQIKAPLAGVVVQILRRKGEWIEPGEKVLRILRLDRLRAEGFVAARELERDLNGAETKVTVELPNKTSIEVRGKIVFVSPEIDPVNSQALVWAEVDNPGPQFVLRPGMKAKMSVELSAGR